MLRHLLFVAGMGFLVALAAVLYAQDRRMQADEPAAATAPTPRTPRAPDRSRDYQRRSSWNERVLHRVQEHLQVTDEEWIVLQPKVEPIVEAQRELRRGMGAWSRFGWNGDDGTPMTLALRDLQLALANPDATADELATKVEELRTTRAKIEAELDAAQAELAKAVTPAEAATLVMIGILD